MVRQSSRARKLRRCLTCRKNLSGQYSYKRHLSTKRHRSTLLMDPLSKSVPSSSQAAKSSRCTRRLSMGSHCTKNTIAPIRAYQDDFLHGFKHYNLIPCDGETSSSDDDADVECDASNDSIKQSTIQCPNGNLSSIEHELIEAATNTASPRIEDVSHTTTNGHQSTDDQRPFKEDVSYVRKRIKMILCQKKKDEKAGQPAKSATEGFVNQIKETEKRHLVEQTSLLLRRSKTPEEMSCGTSSTDDEQ